MRAFLISTILVSCALTAFATPIARSCECPSDEGPGPDCTADQIRRLWPDCSNNGFFFQCTALGSYQRMPCAPGTVFGFYNQTCVHPEDFIEPAYCSTGEVPEWPEEPEEPDGNECVCENEEQEPEEHEPEEQEPEEQEPEEQEPEEQEPEEQEPEEQEPEEQEPEEQEPEEQEPEEEDPENEECVCVANESVHDTEKESLKDEDHIDNGEHHAEKEDDHVEDEENKDNLEDHSEKDPEHENHELIEDEDKFHSHESSYVPAVEALPEIQYKPPHLSENTFSDIEFAPPILTKA